MFRFSPSDLKKQLKRLGLKNVDVEAIEAEEIIVRQRDGKELVLVAPQAVVVKMPGGAIMMQVMAQRVEEREAQKPEEALSFSEEDVRLVAEQTGVSLEEARRALEEAEGDIAAAIMLIEERRRAAEGS
ncbi:nascent polypeptide-associated complex protein [Pyrodictium abyssi]|uniref:Nascent polypeptide-associated complex protein n=1 Tax=Pyrodictium abyssi TaxID=54256 RepID=A0ABM8IZR7_9CREN|nr:nascent polypeptide-associated complex protein [Pyrodictium abyssi]